VAHGLEGSDKPLLIVPSGTENLLANELGFDEKLETIIKTFEAGYIRPLDLGNADGKCFTSIAGFGFDGEVVRRVSEQREGHIDYSDYFWPLWRTFWSYKFDVMKVVVDGKNVNVSSQCPDIETEIDGDPGPALPVEIKVIPQAVNVMVPEGAKPAGIRTRIIRAIG
jgi:diacylglycerol kinase family enzyme